MDKNRKVIKNLNIVIPYEVERNLIEHLPRLQEIYLETYTEELSAIVTDKKSLSHPDNFYSEYALALGEFEYFELLGENQFILRTPDEDTFIRDNRLRFLTLVTEGVVGKFLELPQEDYNNLKTEKSLDKQLSRLPYFFTPDTAKDLRFYLVDARTRLARDIQEKLDKKLVDFPFSNTQGIDIFTPGIEYFEKEILNLEKNINNSIEKVIVQ